MTPVKIEVLALYSSAGVADVAVVADVVDLVLADAIACAWKG